MTWSDTTDNMLKYRFKHLAKLDIEVLYRKYSVGISMWYGGFMKNIDVIFEGDLDVTENELYILPGLADTDKI